VFKVKFDPASITGVSRSQYLSDDRFQALTSANPTEAICCHQYIESMDGTTAIDCEYVMQIVFEVEFFDAVDVGTSLAARMRPPPAPAGPAPSATPQAPAPVLVWNASRRQYEAAVVEE